MGVMSSCKTHLKTWVDAPTRERFVAAAHAQNLSESALLKRLVIQMLAAPGAHESLNCQEPKAHRDARLTVRLRPVDQLLLKDRAAARGMPASTYVATLLRGHLHALPPLPAAELQALRTLTNELSAVGRNVNQLVKIAYRDDAVVIPNRADVWQFFRVCEALRLHVKALLKANADSWNVGASDEHR